MVPNYRENVATAAASELPASELTASQLTAQLLARCRFPPAGTAVSCAVSGGADSLALLILAVAAGLECTAIHVDHGLRTCSAGEAALAATAVGCLGASFEGHRVTVAAGPSVEAQARQARYQVLPDGVLTGHTADDLAETILLNLLRGAGLDGLAPMRDEGRVRRPLLGLRRSETRALCQAVGLVPFEDPSNDDPRFTRNRVRHELLPLLSAVSGRDPVPVLVRQAGLLGRRGRPARPAGGGHRPDRRQGAGRRSRRAGAPGGAPVAAGLGRRRAAPAVVGRGRPGDGGGQGPGGRLRAGRRPAGPAVGGPVDRQLRADPAPCGSG